MKNIKHIKEFLKIYESVNLQFKNEYKLKELLMNQKSFAEGDVHQAIVDMAHDEWKNNKDWSYEDVLCWLDDNFGDLVLFSMYLAKYNYQVGNGGHCQYYDNGYASSDQYPSVGGNIDKHDQFVELFNKLNLKELLSSGSKAYDVISDFNLELEDEIEECSECRGDGEVNCTYCDGTGQVDCEDCNGSGEDNEGEKCDNCDGDGTLVCSECGGNGNERCGECNGEGQIDTGNQIPNGGNWDRLDNRWYNISDKFMEEFNNYLKSLTLEGEKIEDLIPLAKDSQNYNL